MTIYIRLYVSTNTYVRMHMYKEVVTHYTGISTEIETQKQTSEKNKNKILA